MENSNQWADSTPYHSNLHGILQKNLRYNPKLTDHDKHYVSSRNFHHTLLQNMHLFLLALVVQMLLEHDHTNRCKLGFVHENARQASCSLLVKQPKRLLLRFQKFRTYHRTRQRCGSSDSNSPTAPQAILPLCNLNMLLLSL